MSDIDQEIIAKGLTAPRITPADIQANIAGEYYFTAGNGVQANFHYQDELTRLTGAHRQLDQLTFCVLVLQNGFTVTGESACASPENFDAEIGRKIARANAEQKIWPLMGYELKSKMTDPNRCMGKNCLVSIGDHSKECLAEAAKSQGWGEDKA